MKYEHGGECRYKTDRYGNKWDDVSKRQEKKIIKMYYERKASWWGYNLEWGLWRQNCFTGDVIKVEIKGRWKKGKLKYYSYWWYITNDKLSVTDYIKEAGTCEWMKMDACSREKKKEMSDHTSWNLSQDRKLLMNGYGNTTCVGFIYWMFCMQRIYIQLVML